MNEKPRWGYQHPEAPKYVGIAPDLESFDAQFFKVHRKQGLTMDALSRKLLEHAYQAIYDAGISSVELRGKKIGVFVGSAISDYEKVCFYVPTTINAMGIAGCSRSMFANRISYWLDARGPSINIDAACSSSAVALERACDYMKRGICEAAIVGGANLCFHPHVSVHYKRSEGNAGMSLWLEPGHHLGRDTAFSGLDIATCSLPLGVLRKCAVDVIARRRVPFGVESVGVEESAIEPDVLS
ncbi:Fatty acid synthase [Eumeta japonica]|uniref:Fatty acid synthase n=1 Tax=Eumeta variegata TaxID=151549 RepID=A0A4C1XLS6_EUMVA|nr:Fatty acid synthase [Eumeta japonica]